MRLGQNPSQQIQEEKEAREKINEDAWKVFVTYFQGLIEDPDNQKTSIDKLCRQAVRNSQQDGYRDFRVRDADIYIRILRRAGELSYRPSERKIGGFRFATRDEIMRLLENRKIASNLKRSINQEGVIAGWTQWAKGFNTGVFDTYLEGTRTFRILENTQQAVKLIADGGDDSTSVENMCLLFGWKDGTLRMRKPERVTRISNKQTILKNERLRSFLTQELKDIQRSGLYSEFSKALSESIKKWNRVYGEITGIYLPVNVYGGVLGTSLCKILGIRSKKQADIILGLGLQGDVWKNARGKYKKKSQV